MYITLLNFNYTFEKTVIISRHKFEKFNYVFSISYEAFLTWTISLPQVPPQTAVKSRLKWVAGMPAYVMLTNQTGMCARYLEHACIPTYECIHARNTHTLDLAPILPKMMPLWVSHVDSLRKNTDWVKMLHVSLMHYWHFYDTASLWNTTNFVIFNLHFHSDLHRKHFCVQLSTSQQHQCY